jgi:hypothetical protein
MDFNSFSDDFLTMPQILTSDLDLFLSELNILFSTERGSIFGKRTTGNSIEQLLWKTSYNEDYIKSDISRQIEENCLSSQFFNWSVDFKVAKGVSRDIGELTINISNKNSSTVIAAPIWVFK